MQPEPRPLRMVRALFAPRHSGPLELAMFATACIITAPVMIAAVVIEAGLLTERIMG